MGAGGTLAAGCNIGNALTGLSILAVNALVATAAIAGGGTFAIAAGATWARRSPSVSGPPARAPRSP
jgi:hypothetical protein